MNTDKAYLFGLIIGGGVISRARDNLVIKLPYRKWGAVVDNPTRAGQIAQDILTRVRPVFENEYGITVYYTAEPEWSLRCTGNLTPLMTDLGRFGITCTGEMRKNATINGITPFLVDENLKRQFIAGLADSVGSLAPTHRRFTDDFQIISFEFNGFNYSLVLQICNLLREINCHADQILWNHPNQHSTSNPYYRSWRKGFKLRVLLDQYTAQGSFLFQAKQEAARENIDLQVTGDPHVAIPCEEKTLNITPSTIHIAENDIDIPADLRGYHFLHHKHICAVMGCPHAPVHMLLPYLERAEYYINPFPIALRDSVEVVNQIISNTPVMDNRTYRRVRVPVRRLLRLYERDPNTLYGSEREETGYPVSELLQAIAYVSEATRGNLFGTRVRGNFIEKIREGAEEGIIDNVRLCIPDRLTPIIVRNNRFAAIVGPKNPMVYRRLIERDGLRLRVRPIREEDLEDE